MELVALQEHTTLVEIEPGEHLYNNGIDRGLFFIESGIMVSCDSLAPRGLSKVQYADTAVFSRFPSRKLKAIQIIR
jgi:hypothetical protein